MSRDADVYSLLGVDEACSVAIARAAWRAQLREYHPDTTQDPVRRLELERRAKQLNGALETVIDPAKRAEVDRRLAARRNARDERIRADARRAAEIEVRRIAEAEARPAIQAQGAGTRREVATMTRRQPAAATQLFIQMAGDVERRAGRRRAAQPPVPQHVTIAYWPAPQPPDPPYATAWVVRTLWGAMTLVVAAAVGAGRLGRVALLVAVGISLVVLLAPGARTALALALTIVFVVAVLADLARIADRLSD